MPFNDLARNAALDGLDESATAGIKYVGVHQLTDPGRGAIANAGEASGGSYQRVAVTWAPAANGQKANGNALAINVPAGTFGFLTFWSAQTGNTGTEYRGYLPLNGNVRGFGTVDAAGVTSDAIQSSAHGLADGDRVMVYPVLGEPLPSGLVEGTIYYVVSATTDTFKVSTSQGGAAVNVTSQGEVFFQKVVPETFNSPGQITVDPGALVLDANAL